MAAGGAKIIENATLYDDIAAAANDVSFIAAASARCRDMPMREINPRAAAGELLAHQGKTALLFGPEASGLDNDEVVQARCARHRLSQSRLSLTQSGAGCFAAGVGMARSDA